MYIEEQLQEVYEAKVTESEAIMEDLEVLEKEIFLKRVNAAANKFYDFLQKYPITYLNESERVCLCGELDYIKDLCSDIRNFDDILQRLESVENASAINKLGSHMDSLDYLDDFLHCVYDAYYCNTDKFLNDLLRYTKEAEIILDFVLDVRSITPDKIRDLLFWEMSDEDLENMKEKLSHIEEYVHKPYLLKRFLCDIKIPASMSMFESFLNLKQSISRYQRSFSYNK